MAQDVSHLIDALWCDAHGVFVKGWVHTHERPLCALRIRSGESIVDVNDFHDRPDLLSFFPGMSSTRCGFSGYLPCEPFKPVMLEGDTADGTFKLAVSALSGMHPLNVNASQHDTTMETFRQEMKQRGGVVVEIGARVVGPSSSLNADSFRPECEFIGVDIHEAVGVDIVADAHFLSESLTHSSVDGLFSNAVIEHLACPWLFAAEINKVLKIGGLTLHIVPQSYPIHETPNDFWRISSEGLKVLFSPAMGFEVIATGMTTPVRMMVHPDYRTGPILELGLFDGMASSYILARKVTDIASNAVVWPLSKQVSHDQSTKYPKHSVEQTPVDQKSSTPARNSVHHTCPACSQVGNHCLFVTIPPDYRAYKCDACGSLFFHPFPEIDYTSHTEALAIRNYVEMNASIEGVVSNLLNVIPEGTSGKLLDIGCGYGFALDAIRAVRGWTVKGFEPSQYGMLGRNQLRLDIVSDFAAKNEDPSNRYDVVHCSEVIEHVRNVGQFLDILTSYLSDDGILVLTTPNPSKVSQHASDSTSLALLSPGAHTILFSTGCLRELLQGAGLTHVHVDDTSDSSLFYASRKPIHLSGRNWNDTILSYLESALSLAPEGSSLSIGLRYRLFRSAMDHGYYDLAARAFDPSLAVEFSDPNSVRTIEDLAARWPMCIAASTYYVAMFDLICRARHADAVNGFRSAHALCRKKIDLDPSNAVVEADLIWRCKYHEALALSYCGDAHSAHEILEGLTVILHEPRMPPDLIETAKNLKITLAGRD